MKALWKNLKKLGYKPSWKWVVPTSLSTRKRECQLSLQSQRSWEQERPLILEDCREGRKDEGLLRCSVGKGSAWGWPDLDPWDPRGGENWSQKLSSALYSCDAHLHTHPIARWMKKERTKSPGSPILGFQLLPLPPHQPHRATLFFLVSLAQPLLFSSLAFCNRSWQRCFSSPNSSSFLRSCH